MLTEDFLQLFIIKRDEVLNPRLVEKDVEGNVVEEDSSCIIQDRGIEEVIAITGAQALEEFFRFITSDTPAVKDS